MPKIVINEYDLSKAGTVPYENFSVVVPGFLADDKYVEVADENGTHYELNAETKAVFDENGVYECSSQLDFENNVGKKAAVFTSMKANDEPTAPFVSTIIELNPELNKEYVEYVQATNTDGSLQFDDNGEPVWTENIANQFDTENEVLVTTKTVVIGVDSEGKPVEKTQTKIEYLNSEAFVTAYNAMLVGQCPTKETPIPNPEDANEDATFKVYRKKAAKNIRIGELKTKSCTYVEIEAPTAGAVIFTGDDGEDETLALSVTGAVPTEKTYYVIEEEDKGFDGTFVEDRVSHYGNQIAYELLGLGYTVLFKAMMPYTGSQLIEAAKDAKKITTEGSIQLLNNEGTAVAQINDGNFWECLKDKSTYDFRYLMTGLLTNNDLANKCILEVADHTEEILLDDASIQDGRGDCIALIDLDSATYEGKTQKDAIPAMAKESAEWASAYAAVFAPYVTYLMSDDPVYNNKTFPASFHYLACAANSSNNNFSEWYANAGYTRGVAKYTIESTGCKFGEVAIQALEPRFMLKVGKELNEKKTAFNDINTVVAINLIVKIKSSYYLWGNRTGKKLGTRGASDGDLRAQDFLNIRQLCCTIKKQVYTTCRRLTFDPNSNNLWINFRSLLTPMLEEMKADQGIKDYKFVKNDTDRKALLSAKIRIVPIEAVEDFEIGLYLEDTLDEVALTEA
jgi:hypothetical protein